MASTASVAKKLTYKVMNWREYNESLVRRGDITFWFDEDVLDAWEHDNAPWKVGRPFIYSDLAVETLLTAAGWRVLTVSSGTSLAARWPLAGGRLASLGGRR